MNVNVLHFDTPFQTRLLALEAGKRPSGVQTFPPGLPNEEIRAHETMTPLEWVKQLYAKADPKHQPDIPVLNNVALAIEVKWSSRDGSQRIDEVHCQAAVFHDRTVADALAAGTIDEKMTSYIRLDFEPRNQGQYVFPDPIPHVHARTKGEPRFPVSLSPAAPHVDFMELILRNYARQIWDAWAIQVWEERIAKRLPQRERFDRLRTIRTAFAEGRYKELCTPPLSDDLRRWKTALQREKMGMFSLIRDERCDAISY